MSEPWFQTAFGRFYPLLYAHRDATEAGRCLDVFNRLVPFARESLILDLGCGAGRHLAHLQQMDCTAVGLDLSAELLALARSSCDIRSSGRLIRGDMRYLPCATGVFGGVLSLFTAFGYFGELMANEPQVAEISRILAPQGHWYLDYFDAGKVRRELTGGASSLRQRDLGPVTVQERRSLTASGDQVLKEVCLRQRAGQAAEASKLGIPTAGVTYTEAVALFDLTELDELAGHHGLVRVAGAGDYAGAALHAGDRWLLVYRKENNAPLLHEKSG